MVLNALVTTDQVELTFPVYGTTPSVAPQALLKALGIAEIVNAEFNSETKILLIEIESITELAVLKPDCSALIHSHNSINGVLVTAPSTSDEFDFHSRYFWPWSGTNEDPATGGTHTFLAPYWASRLNKTKIISFQSSKRTGHMEVELVDGRLIIRSQATIVLDGELRI